MHFTLKADDLIRKNGFDNSLIFLDVLDDAGLPSNLDPSRLVETLSAMGGQIVQTDPSNPVGSSLYEVVLYKVVEQKLMPKLPGFTLVLNPVGSNSVRLKEGFEPTAQSVSVAIQGISAVVEMDEVLTIAASVLSAYELSNKVEHSLR